MGDTKITNGPIGPMPLAPELARFETANDVKEKKLKVEQEEEAKTERLRKGEFSPYLQVPPVEKRYSTSVPEPKPKKMKLVYQPKANCETWVPPVDQSGDGSTDLNIKLGY